MSICWCLQICATCRLIFIHRWLIPFIFVGLWNHASVSYPFQSLAGISKVLLAKKYHISKMKVVVLWGNCPTNESNCPVKIIIIVLRCRHSQVDILVLRGN